jgi:SHS2 domain-containing protein
MIAFEEIEHTADTALRIYGRELAELFVNAARGLNSLLAANKLNPENVITRKLKLKADDAESLLVDWLSEIAYLAERDGVIFTQFDVHTISPTRITATLKGSRYDRLSRHIKAVTYHDLNIEKSTAGYAVTVVFDV